MLNSEENFENFEKDQEGGGILGSMFGTAKKPETLPPLPPNFAPLETPSERRERLLREEQRKKKYSLEGTKQAIGTMRKSIAKGIQRPIRDVTDDQYINIADFSKQSTNSITSKNFNSEYQKFIKKYLTNQDDLTNSTLAIEKKTPLEKLEKTLLLDKVKIIRSLTQVRFEETQKITTTLFNHLALFNNENLNEANTDTISKLNTMIKNLHNTFLTSDKGINIINLIKETVQNEYKTIKKLKSSSFSRYNNILRCFWQLLITFFYPNIILKIISDTMMAYIKIIKEKRDVLLANDSTIISDLFEQLNLKLSPDESGYVSPPYIPFVSRQSSMSSLMGINDLDSDDEDGDGDESDDEDGALPAGGLVTNHVGGNSNIIDMLKNSTNSNIPYVKNSASIFYNALTNFAVSISIYNNDKDKFKQQIFTKLKEIFMEKFNIQLDDANVELDEGLTKAEMAASENALNNAKQALEQNEYGAEILRLEEELNQLQSELDAATKDDSDARTKLALEIEINTINTNIAFIADRDDIIGDLYINYINAKNRLKGRSLPLADKKDINIVLRDLFTFDLDNNASYNLYSAIMDNIYSFDFNYSEINNVNYISTIDSYIINGIGRSNMFQINSVQAVKPISSEYPVQVQHVAGGKHRTRRHKKHAGTRRHKKLAGTRRHKKRSGTHRKRKNTTR